MTPEQDRERLLAVATEEEWQEWLCSKMIESHYRIEKPCLFCLAAKSSKRYDCYCCSDICCCDIAKYSCHSDRYFGGYARLQRAGIVP